MGPKQLAWVSSVARRGILGGFIWKLPWTNQSDPGGSGRAGCLAFLIQHNRSHLHERSGVRAPERPEPTLCRPAMVTMLTFGQLQRAGCNHFIVHHFMAATYGATDCRLRPGEYGFHIFDLPG